MKGKRVSLLLLAATLSGCATPSGGAFDYDPSSSLPTALRNGDAKYEVDERSDLYDSTRLAQSGELVERLNSGEDVLLLWHQTTCAHCLTFQEVFAPYIKDSNALCYAFNEDNLVSGVAELKEAFPSMENDFPSLATPYLFRLDASTKRATRINFTGHTSTVGAYEGFMKETINLENVYTFRSFSNFERFCKDNSALGYVQMGNSFDSYFTANVYPVARKSKKVTAVLEIAYMGEAELSKFNASFGEPASELLSYIEEKPSVISLTEGAKALIDSYYKA